MANVKQLKAKYPILWDSVEYMVADDVKLVLKSKKDMVDTISDVDIKRIAHNAAFTACSTQWTIDNKEKSKL